MRKFLFEYIYAYTDVYMGIVFLFPIGISLKMLWVKAKWVEFLVKNVGIIDVWVPASTSIVCKIVSEQQR